MIRPQLVTPPAALPLSLGEAKLQCRVDFDDDDALLEAYVASAVAHLDGYTGILGRCLINQVWRQDYRGWSRALRLPFPDVSAASVTYVSDTGAEKTVDTGLFEIVEEAAGAVLVFGPDFSAPSLSASTVAPVRVQLTAGFGAAATNIPKPIITAMRLMIGHWYENREAVVTGTIATALPLSVDALIAPYRRVGV